MSTKEKYINFFVSLESILKEKNISKYKFAQDFGISDGTISNWRKSNPTLDTFTKIADYLNVSMDDLAGRNISTKNEIVFMANITIQGTVKADSFTHSDNIDLGKVAVPASRIGHKKCYALKVSGESMLLRFYDGDIVVVLSQSTAEKCDIIIALLEDKETMKNFKPFNGGIVLQPLNDNYDPIVLSGRNAEEFRIEGKVLFS